MVEGSQIPEIQKSSECGVELWLMSQFWLIWVVWWTCVNCGKIAEVLCKDDPKEQLIARSVYFRINFIQPLLQPSGWSFININFKEESLFLGSSKLLAKNICETFPIAMWLNAVFAISSSHNMVNSWELRIWSSPPIIMVECEVGDGVDWLLVPQLEKSHRQVATIQRLYTRFQNIHQSFGEQRNWQSLGLAPPSVGQDVVELICQRERKTQQNATFYLWLFLSLKPEFRWW